MNELLKPLKSKTLEPIESKSVDWRVHTHLGVDEAGWVELDLVHVNQRRANVLAHLQHITFTRILLR
jgi:hypothetical protein